MNNPKARKKLVSRSGKTLWTKAAVLGLVFIVSASLLAMTYSLDLSALSETTANSMASSAVSSASASTAEWNLTEMGTTGTTGANQLTFLDQEVFAFNVPNEWFPYDTNYHYWHEYSFGSTVHSNAVMALCMLKLDLSGSSSGGADVGFCTQDPQVKQPLGWYGGQENIGFNWLQHRCRFDVV